MNKRHEKSTFQEKEIQITEYKNNQTNYLRSAWCINTRTFKNNQDNLNCLKKLCDIKTKEKSQTIHTTTLDLQTIQNK